MGWRGASDCYGLGGELHGGGGLDYDGFRHDRIHQLSDDIPLLGPEAKHWTPGVAVLDDGDMARPGKCHIDKATVVLALSARIDDDLVTVQSRP